MRRRKFIHSVLSDSACSGIVPAENFLKRVSRLQRVTSDIGVYHVSSELDDSPRGACRDRICRNLFCLLYSIGAHRNSLGSWIRSSPEAILLECTAKEWGGMHCTACDAELILTHVVPEHTGTVRGFEHHTFVCSECHITTHRVAFTRHGREEEPQAPAGLLGQVMARVRGYCT